jgi:hypothetical protein
MSDDDLDLFAVGDEPLAFEPLAEGNALASVSTGTSVSSASCPATTASSWSSFSTYT